MVCIVPRISKNLHLQSHHEEVTKINPNFQEATISKKKSLSNASNGIKVTKVSIVLSRCAVVGTTKRPRRERRVGVSYARLVEGEGSRLNEANSPSRPGVSLPVSTVLRFPRLLCSLSPSQFQSNSVYGRGGRGRNRFWKDEEREKVNGYRTKKHAIQRLRTYGLPLI